MLDKLDSGKRLILAAAISFVFFLLYDYYYYSDVMKTNQQSNPQEKQYQTDTAQQAPTTDSASPSMENQESSSAAQAPVSNTNKDVLAVVEIVDGTFTIDSLGRVSSASLEERGREEEISLFNTNYTKPLEVRFSDTAVNEEAFKISYTASKEKIDARSQKQTLVLTQELADTTVTKEITFYPKGNYDLKIYNTKKLDFFVTPGFRPDNEVDMMTVHGVLTHEFDDTTEVVEDGDATGHESFRNAKLVSSFDRYYTTLFYNFSEPFDVWINKVRDDDPLPFVSSKGGNLEIKGYMGPKNVSRMKSIEPQMISAVEYGIFTFLAKPLFVGLDYINSYIGNWGWTIVVFILIVKIILFPLSHKGMVSMNKLKILSPKIKELQKKYKGEPQKLQVHMMDLYKKHGANPLGGCLPFLLQIPIFFAIYRVLVNAIELRGSQWLYISDLSAMDPYFILPILMGVSMFLQQKLAPSNFTDPMQEKIMKFLPVIFTFFFFTFPAGLVLYWLANNILSIAQQYFVNKSMEKQKVIA